MSRENLKSMPDADHLESAQRVADELEQRDLRSSRALGEYAVDDTEWVAIREETEPFLVPGSAESKEYAREQGPSGRPRWMERFSKVDILGQPTVFSDRSDPTDRGV